jgi:hypothetical protein
MSKAALYSIEILVTNTTPHQKKVKSNDIFTASIYKF